MIWQSGSPKLSTFTMPSASIKGFRIQLELPLSKVGSGSITMHIVDISLTTPTGSCLCPQIRSWHSHNCWIWNFTCALLIRVWFSASDYSSSYYTTFGPIIDSFITRSTTPSSVTHYSSGCSYTTSDCLIFSIYETQIRLGVTDFSYYNPTRELFIFGFWSNSLSYCLWQLNRSMHNTQIRHWRIQTSVSIPSLLRRRSYGFDLMLLWVLTARSLQHTIRHHHLNFSLYKLLRTLSSSESYVSSLTASDCVIS